MKTIKIIDLFIKRANNEKLPNKILIGNNEFELENGIYYTGAYNDEPLSMEYDLNEKAEIIEEEKEIEKAFNIELLEQCDNWLQKRDVNIKSDFELNPYILEAITRNFKLLYHKQCELIDAVNKMGKEK